MRFALTDDLEFTTPDPGSIEGANLVNPYLFATLSILAGTLVAAAAIALAGTSR